VSDWHEYESINGTGSMGGKAEVVKNRPLQAGSDGTGLSA